MAEIKPVESANDSLIETVAENTAKGTEIDTESLLDETQKTVTENDNKVTEAEVSDITSDDNGAPGEQPKKRADNASLKGIMSGDVTHATAARSLNVVDDSTYVTFIDADAASRDIAMAQSIAKKREANIVRNGTPVSADAQQAITKHPNDVTVYPKDADAVRRIVGGIGVAAPMGSAIAVDENEDFISADAIVHAGDDYLYQSECAKGHGGTKDFTKHQIVMFEEYDEDMYATKKFRAVKTGNYLITGINPLASRVKDTNTSKEIGTVTRCKGDVTEQVPVMVSNHKLFTHIELTSTLDDIVSTSEEAAMYLTANESKMHIGAIEAIADDIRRTFTNIIDDNNLVDYPEFYPDIQRSTLVSMDPALTGGRDYSCYNTQEAILNLFKRAMDSEIMWLWMRSVWGLEPKTMFKGMKFARTQGGRDNKFPYYTDVLKADVKNYANYTTPTILNYLGTLDNAPKYDDWSKLLYAYGKIAREVETMQKSFDESTLAKEYFTKVTTNMAKLQQIVDCLAWGKITEGGTSTADIAKKGGSCGIIIGFDPNDLVDFDTVPYSGDLVAPHLCCGWFNIRNKSTNIINDNNRYNFAPTWLNAIVNGLRNTVVVDRLISKTTKFAEGPGGSGCAKDRMIIPTYTDAENIAYDLIAQPVVINNDHPEWINFFIMHIIANEPNNTMSKSDSHSGYLRLFEGYEKLGVLSRLLGDITIADAISKVINNAQLYPQDAASNIMELPSLWDSAKNFISSEARDHQIAALGDKNYTYMVMSPDLLDRNVFGLYDFEDIDGQIDFETAADILELATPKFGGAANTKQKLYLLNIGENDCIVVLANVGKNETAATAADVKPLLLRRRLPDVDRADKRFNVTCDGASDIAHSTEAPQDALYSHDNFYHVSDCDAYVLRVRKSYIAGDATPGSRFEGKDSAPYTWMMDVCPVYKVAQPSKPTGPKKLVKAEYSSGVPTIVASFASAKNIVIKGSKPVSLNRSRGCKLGEVNSDFKESKLLRSATIPSLYGGKRRCPAGLIKTHPAEGGYWTPANGDYDGSAGSYALMMQGDSKATYLSGGTTNTRGFRGITNRMEGFTSKSIDSYAPYLVLDNDHSVYATAFASVDALTKEEFQSLFGYGSIDVADANYWIKRRPKYVRTFGTTIGGGSEYVKNSNSLASVFADGNKLVHPGAFIDTAVYDFSDKAKWSEHKDSTIEIAKTPGNHISPYSMIALMDAWDKYMCGRLYMLVPASFICYCYDDGAGVANAASACAMSTIPSDFALNPVLRSGYYYCDYRDYVVHKPVTTLNERWYLRGLAESLFAKQFRTK